MINLAKTPYNLNSHCMIDIETLSTNKDAVMLSISAVQFNPYTGQTFSEFETFLDVDAQLANGQTISHSTLMFWLGMEDGARTGIVEGCTQPAHINEALANFSHWYNTHGMTKIWGKGPGMDCSILSNAYEKANLKRPWAYDAELCVRTFIAMIPEIKNLPFSGILHRGIDDAKHQIKIVQEVIKNLTNGTTE